MKKILFMHHVSTIGGGSYCLLNLIKALDWTLYKPVVMLQYEGPLVDELKKIGVDSIIFPEMTAVPYNKSLFLIGSIWSYLKVKKSLKTFKELLIIADIDIVYLNNMMIYPYLKVAKEIGLKTIIHIREHWPINDHKIQLSWAQNAVYNFADRLIAINHCSANMFPKQKAVIIYDWIDMDERRNGPSLKSLINENDQNKKVYLFMGGIQPIKGTIEIIQTFINNVLDNDKLLLLLGVDQNMSWNGVKGKIKRLLSVMGYKTYREKVIRLCKTDKRIICAPAVYNVTNILEEAYCLISYFTIPHANLSQAEAIILGTPVIAAKTPESMEYSMNGELSILYPINDIKSFADAIEKLDYRSISAIKEKLNENRNAIKQLFSPQRNIAKLNGILKEIL